MKFKKILIICFLCSLQVHSQLAEKKQTVAFIKNYKLLNSIKGNWALVHMSTDAIEVDCENVEKSFNEQLQIRDIDSLSLRHKFDNSCKNMARGLLEVKEKYVILQKDTMYFKLNDTLKSNVILTKNGSKDFLLEIKKLENNYLKWSHSNEFWLIFKKNND